MPSIGAGPLRERIAFESRAAIDDGYGNVVSGDWTLLTTCAARVEPLRGAETVQAMRLAGRQPVKITVRRSSLTMQIKPDFRARDVRSGELYNVRSVMNPDEKNRFLEMECELGVAV